ncbi:MAG: NAD(P)/FAD-dependent oxidoreductase [Anaerolineae bacterium]|nr:NAD(P)/FAD-dependent oxidoreductase [Anaerolineae bacterium]
MENYDVIIIGAGPAGISTALHLQQIAPELASRTLILEKAQHPRLKPCAGGILPDGIHVLRDLGLDCNEVPHVRAVVANFQFEGRGVAATARDESIAFIVVYRPELDAWLVQKARERGLNIREKVPVQQVLPRESGVEVVTPDQVFRAQVVVGADGAHSVVRRAVSKRRPRFARTILLWVPPSPCSSHQPDQAYFEFSCIAKGIPGYVWDFPVELEGRPMRCWGVYTVSQSADGMRNVLQEIMAEHGYRLEEHRLYGGIIPQFAPEGPFAAPRALLVGDAAGVDPFYGEGIAPALGYGRLAALAIADAFARGDFSFQNYRYALLGSELGKTLRWRLFATQTVYRFSSPAVQRLIWQRSGGIIHWTIEHLFTGWARRGKRHK